MTADDHALEQMARELYPDNTYLQQQWLRAVRLVRTTVRGWLIDVPVLPKVAPRPGERERGRS
jgi:hypothetical protein